MRIAFAAEGIPRPPQIPWRTIGVLILCLSLAIVSLLLTVIVVGLVIGFN
jgi:hypothetical protein